MDININELKVKAKKIDETSNPSVFRISAIFVIVILIMQLLSSKLMSGGATESNIQQATEMMQQGNYELAQSYLMQFMPSRMSTLIDTALYVMRIVLGAGFTIFIINTVRKNEPVTGNLLDGFAVFGRLILLYILQWLMIALWSMLLIVPGIIAFYNYRMALFLLLDNPDMSVTECLRKSKELMRGHKMELFKLDFSFLGWLLISMVFFPVQIFTEPYFKTTYVLYYQQLAGITDYTDYGEHVGSGEL